ncbi:hypothetical protein CEP51_009036 [Fusarium floridanum]|uniref:Uncharacterized protein n=1 Tax=Fusarium floridanum TaxID=1325733 RepID=A0A428RJ08_9HYPO|nr:hypothetical protein CEP51_009036 [Fusarium floridanum]
MRPSNTLYPLLLAACSLHISPATAALDRTRSQFKHFFPTVETYAKERFHKACPEQFANYFNESLPDPGQGHKYSGDLMECILEEWGELNKANMAVTAILLALLPAGLVQFGPSMAEISILSTRRPFLATLLGFGLMSPNPAEFDFEGILEKAGKGSASLPPIKALDGRYFIAKVLVSLVEYVIAMGATANCFFQIYRFTYLAISLAPLVAYVPGVPEAATLFGWAFLNLPLYLLSFVVFALAFHRATPQPRFNKRRNRFIEFIIAELTPCGQGPALRLQRREGRETLQRLLGSLTRLIAGLHIIVGTTLIGSIVLIPLGDCLPVIYSFVFAAILTRAVLSYEISCLAKRTEIEPAERLGPDRLLHETHSLGPKQYEGLRQGD